MVHQIVEICLGLELDVRRNRGWQLLVSELVEYTMDGEWISVTVTFTPPTNMNAIAFGASCADLGGLMPRIFILMN